MTRRPSVHVAIKLMQRHISSLRSPTLARLRDELISRPPNITYDHLSPTPSNLLDVSLAAFLPRMCFPQHICTVESLTFGQSSKSSASAPVALPQGHHIVYLPPHVLTNSLHPDGTDTLHSPVIPSPFVRRLWAGGALTFNTADDSRLYLDGTQIACEERIRDVTIKGPEGEEKMFVHIERTIGHERNDPGSQRWVEHDDDQNNGSRVRHRHWQPKDVAVVEQRVLVFMREVSTEAVQQDIASKNERVVKPPHTADVSVILTPPPSLLFRFSALTFNAHKIHIDPEYTRYVEGHRNLLVHGPLSLILMLSVLRSQLKAGEYILTFSYRNLAPLYAQEQMKICVRRDLSQVNKFEVWIEGSSGGYAVKGSATVGKS